MLNQRETAAVREICARLETMFDAETATIARSSGKVAQAALLRRDALQDLLRLVRPLLP